MTRLTNNPGLHVRMNRLITTSTPPGTDLIINIQTTEDPITLTGPNNFNQQYNVTSNQFTATLTTNGTYRATGHAGRLIVSDNVYPDTYSGAYA